LRSFSLFNLVLIDGSIGTEMNLVQTDGRICYEFKFKSVFKSIMRLCVQICYEVQSLGPWLGARTGGPCLHTALEKETQAVGGKTEKNGRRGVRGKCKNTTYS
jgi:hypothetical protein